jgi:hypothetical protein
VRLYLHVVAVVPPPAGLSHNRRRTLPGNAFIERVGSSRAHSRNYHNWKRTPSVTNQSPRPMEYEMRFHVVCLSFHHIRLSGILEFSHNQEGKMHARSRRS